MPKSFSLFVINHCFIFISFWNIIFLLKSYLLSKTEKTVHTFILFLTCSSPFVCNTFIAFLLFGRIGVGTQCTTCCCQVVFQDHWWSLRGGWRWFAIHVLNWVSILWAWKVPLFILTGSCSREYWIIGLACIYFQKGK